MYDNSIDCPTPESHNWGCGCPTDRLPARNRQEAEAILHEAMDHGVYDASVRQKLIDQLTEACRHEAVLTTAGIRDAARQAAGQGTCRPVDVDGETVLVRGNGTLTEPEQHLAADIVRAARRKYDAEPKCPNCSHLWAHHDEDVCGVRSRRHGVAYTCGCTAAESDHPAVGQPDTQQQTQLTATDRAFLNWALDQAAHVMASDGAQFDNDGHASMARLRRVADEAAQ